MKKLTVNLQPPYDIYFNENILTNKELANFLAARRESLVIITDSNLEPTIAKSIQAYLQQHQLAAEILSFPAGEEYKTREIKQQLEDALFQKQCGRDTCLIAVGGGVVTDITGFVAATYCRGISAVYIPTSLLAMVDASIGGKTAVNTPFGKNMIGCFYQPQAVFIDPDFLFSLSDAEYKNGLAEIIKHALIADAELFKQCHPEQSEGSQDVKEILRFAQDDICDVIFQSCQIKKNVVEQDERDYGLRHVLNFGHTIGHAIETLEDYKIRHGEAVAIGMLVEAYLSMQMGFLSEDALTEICNLITSFQFPLQTKAFDDLDLFKQTLVLDKKSSAKTARFVLLDAIGKVHHDQQQYSFPVPEKVLDAALSWIKSLRL